MSVQPPLMSMADTVVLVCGKHHVKLAEIYSADRTGRVSRCRHEAMALCYRAALPSRSMTAVGRHFGRHHAIVVLAVRRYGTPQEISIPVTGTISSTEVVAMALARS